MPVTRSALQIVDGAFRLCGVLVPSSTQRDEAFDALNDMLALWSAERLMVPQVIEESFTLVTGTAVYTIGAGGTFNTVRPMKIESAYLRDATSIDTPVDPTMSLMEYNGIGDKSTKARPGRLYYAPEFPLGKIHFDAPPDAAYTFRVFSWKPLTSLGNLGSSVSMPPEYFKALRLSLAVDLAPVLGVTLENSVIQQAVGAHLSIRNLNKPPVVQVAHDPAIVRELLR